MTKKFSSPYSDNARNDLRIRISRQIRIYIHKYTRVGIRGLGGPKGRVSVPLSSDYVIKFVRLVALYIEK
jgi:hypothetical protein